MGPGSDRVLGTAGRHNKLLNTNVFFFGSTTIPTWNYLLLRNNPTFWFSLTKIEGLPCHVYVVACASVSFRREPMTCMRVRIIRIEPVIESRNFAVLYPLYTCDRVIVYVHHSEPGPHISVCQSRPSHPHRYVQQNQFLSSFWEVVLALAY